MSENISEPTPSTHPTPTRELLAENPIPDYVAESKRVLEILKRSPDDPEVDGLLDSYVFQDMIVESYFGSMREARDRHERQDGKEQYWLEKVLSAYGYTKQQSHMMVSQFLKNYTTNTGDGWEVWQKQQSIFLERLEVMRELNEDDPTNALSLTNRWGITAFERHGGTNLLGQLHYPELRDELCVTPRSDHNGAFEQLGQQLSGYAERAFFVEAGSATELARIGLRLRNEGRKFTKIIIAAHSDGSDLKLANFDQGHPLGVKQFSQERTRRWVSSLGVVADHAELTLMACSTGKPGGLQDELIKIPAVMSVSAPTEVASSRAYGTEGIRHTDQDGQVVTRLLQKY